MTSFKAEAAQLLRAPTSLRPPPVHRQRGEIRQLQRAGVPTAAAEALLDRMLNNIDLLCAERDNAKQLNFTPEAPASISEWYKVSIFHAAAILMLVAFEGFTRSR